MKHKRFRGGLACCILGALTGCAVGPNYRSPEPQIADSAPASFAESSLITSGSPPPGEWWVLYRDPAIDALVHRALIYNTDLEQAAASLALARGALEQARVGLFPSTALTGGATYGGTLAGGSGSSANPVGATSTTARREWTYEAGFDASYEVDLFGRIRRGIEAARYGVEAQIAAQDLSRVTVAAETTRAYVQVCTYGEQVDVARRNLAVVSNLFMLDGRQRRLGLLSQLDVVRQQALVEAARAAVPDLEGQRRSSLYQLAVMTGVQPEAVSPEAIACRRAPQLIDPIPCSLGRFSTVPSGQSISGSSSALTPSRSTRSGPSPGSLASRTVSG